MPPTGRAWRRLGLLLLLALPACAVPQAGPPDGGAPVAIVKPPPLVPAAGDIAGPLCVAEHHAVIDSALAIARPRLAAAIALIEAEPGHPHVRRWFGTAPPAEVAERLRRIAAWIAAPADVKFLCNDPPVCNPASRMAYVSRAGGLLGLCPAFFRARTEGFDSNWGVLIHEASHLVAGTRDHVYGPTAAQILAKEDPARAAENADNYEYFVETLDQRAAAGGPLRRGIGISLAEAAPAR
jgi:hypothetical protein